LEEFSKNFESNFYLFFSFTIGKGKGESFSGLQQRKKKGALTDWKWKKGRIESLKLFCSHSFV
jgi:hypothetical protein